MFERRQMGYWMVAAGATLFSTKAIFIKLAYRDDLDATLMLGWRMIFSLPLFVLAGVWAARQKRQRGEALPSFKRLGAAAATGCLGYWLSAYTDFKGLEYISAHLERLLLFTYPIFVMVLGALFWKQPFTRHGLIGAGISYAGLALVFGMDLPTGGNEVIIGSVFVLACALIFATYQLMAKSYIMEMGSILFTSVAMAAGGVACIIHHMVVDGSFAASSWFLWMSFGCAVFATVIPSFLINAGLGRTSAQAVGMISTISPLVTIVLAVVILGEPFSWFDAVGSALVVAGIGYFTLADSRTVPKLPQAG